MFINCEQVQSGLGCRSQNHTETGTLGVKKAMIRATENDSQAQWKHRMLRDLPGFCAKADFWTENPTEMLKSEVCPSVWSSCTIVPAS